MINFKFLQNRITKIVAEVLIILTLIVTLATLFMAWRLMSGPVNIGFAKNYIEDALADKERGFYVTIDDAAIYWPKIRGPLFMGIQGVRLYNKEDRKIISLEEAGISLSKRRLITGQVSPTALLITRPNLYVIRKEDNSFDFGFETPETPIITTASEQKETLQHALTYIARPGNEINKHDPLAYLRRLEIQNANIVIEDQKLQASWHAPDFDVLFTSKADGLYSEIKMGLEDQEQDIKSGIEIDLFYNWDTKNIDATANIINFDTHLLSTKIPELAELDEHDIKLNGKIQSSFNENLNLQHISLALQSDKGNVSIPQIREEPLSYENLKVEALYDATKQNLAIPAIKLDLEDVGIAIDGNLNLKTSEGASTLTGMLSGKIPHLEHKKLVSLFPQSLSEDDSHEWVAEKIKDATYHNLSADADLIVKADKDGWHFDLKDMKSRFDFENAEVHYKWGLTPVKQGKGAALFDLAKDTMAVHVTDGKINDIDVKKGTVFLEDVIAVGKGTVDLDLLLNGPLQSHLHYITGDPINFNENGSMDINAVKGHADLDVKMLFPTRKNVLLKDMDINITGNLTNAYLPAVAGDIPLKDSTLKIKIDNTEATVEGTAKLLDTDVNLTHKQFLKSEGKPHKSITKANLRLTPEIRQNLDMDLSDFLEGAPQTRLIYTKYNSKPSEADLELDLKGTHFYIKPFHYTLPIGAKGTATLKAYVKDDTLTEIKDLAISAPGLTIEPSRILFKNNTDGKPVLDRGKISRMILGETIVEIDLERSENGQIKVVMQGPFLDATRFLNKNSEEENDEPPDNPVLVSVSVDQMRTAKDQTVQYAKLYIDRDISGAFNQFEVDAIAGKGDIYLRYKPNDKGKRVFHLEADDAGATLKAFGIYDKIQGGKLVVYGEPRRGFYDRNLLGSAIMTDFKVADAPSLAKLLSILSLPGMLQMMENEGLSFTKLEADFDWLYHPNGSKLILKDGRTSGNSIGLTFDGKFDRNKEEVKVSGTIIPLSGINKIIGNIPLVGDLITGGTGTLFAATYTMEGDIKDPDIDVNPLSVLAPGVLRRILFE